MKQQKREETTLSDLFNDGFVEIFCFLPVETLLTSIPLVSKQFFHVVKTQISENRWKKILLGNFDFETNPNPPNDFSGFKDLCYEKFKEYMISKSYRGMDDPTSRIRTISKEVDEKIVSHEAYDENYLPEKDTLRKSTVTLRIYAPTQNWEEITIEDLCRIRGSLEEPEIFDGTLKVIGKEGLIFQIEYEEGQVFLKEQSCADLINLHVGRDEHGPRAGPNDGEEDPEEEEDDEDGTGKFSWMPEFFRILKLGLSFEHTFPLIEEFVLSPYDGMYVPEDEDIEELFPMLEEDEVDVEEIAELVTSHPVEMIDDEIEEEEEEEEEEDLQFIDDGNDGDDDFFAQGADNEGGGGVIILDDDDDDDDDLQIVSNRSSGKVTILDIDDDSDDEGFEEEKRKSGNGEVIILDDNEDVEEDYEEKDDDEDDEDDDVEIITQ